MSSAGSMMTHRCQLERDITAGTSDYHDFQPMGDPVMCKLWAVSGNEVIGPEKAYAQSFLKAAVPISTDIKVLDAIHGVTDRRGNFIDERLLQVKAMARRRDHIEVSLEVIEP